MTSIAIKLNRNVTTNAPNGTTNFPYVLDPTHPTNAATTGDNFRDNVEQVYIQTPENGKYTVVITHKGILSNGWQAVSVAHTGQLPAPPEDFRITQFKVEATNQLSWGAIPSATYRVESTTNLMDPNGWREMTGDINALRTNVIVAVTNGFSDPVRFFRIRRFHD